MDEPYERLKELTRGRRVDGAAMRAFVAGLGLPDDVRARLEALTPGTYTGLASALVDYLAYLAPLAIHAIKAPIWAHESRKVRDDGGRVRW